MKTRLGRRLWLLGVLAMTAAALVPLRAHAQTAVATLLGTWTAPPGGTVSQVVIAGAPGAYTIHIKAPCTPTPCDWGTRPLTIYAPSPAIKVGKIGGARFNQGFVERIVVVTAMDATAPFLRVDVYSRFTGTGRSNYATTQTLH